MKRLLIITPFMAFGYLFVVACNDGGLTKAPTATPSPIWSGATATPTPTPAIVAVCPDNADRVIPYPNDPDDPADKGDALICIWYCATDPNIGVWTPHEIVEVWDFDPNGYLTSYPAPIGYPFATTPNTTNCNAWPGP